jgi:hypothetical protein
MNARERVEAILRREPGGFRRLFIQAELLGPPLARRRGRGRPPGMRLRLDPPPGRGVPASGGPPRGDSESEGT